MPTIIVEHILVTGDERERILPDCGWSLQTGAMWAGLGLVLALSLLPGGGAETEGGGEGTRCKLAPTWSIGEASRMDNLRLKLEKHGLMNVTYMVVNHQGKMSQQLHNLLQQKLPESIPLYKQNPEEPDVWQALSGDKDDFLIYDRCGRLTYHISLPYSILTTPYVEEAVRETYCKNICGSCQYDSPQQQEACNRTVEAVPDVQPEREEEVGATGRHSHDRGHGHHHGHHGDRRGQGGHHGSTERQGHGNGGQHQHVHHTHHGHTPDHAQHGQGHAHYHIQHGQGQVAFDAHHEEALDAPQRP
ncbi:hypothetical protein AGOR_G00046390 [Albula goreensis]|uniref:Selenoprotein P N-terminal domain-containing protein n=1 Tax=Albula goreensis TaxID=1534307 RepID=A0A8T3DW81_9TELE|nr:hypothetical protein AGOR_G00046390 [Albula goreensis]